jgi:hypothetical protein
MKKMFAHTGFLKIAHCLALCGPLGIYMFEHLELPPEIFAMVCVHILHA